MPGAMELTEYMREVHANRTLPASTAATVRAMMRDPLIMELLATLRVTEYHYVAEREGKDPVIGGPNTDFREILDECEMILDPRNRSGSSKGPVNPFADIVRMTILDAHGRALWSKERG